MDVQVGFVVRKSIAGRDTARAVEQTGPGRNGDSDEPYSDIFAVYLRPPNQLARDSALPAALEKDGAWSKSLQWIPSQGS